MNKCKRTARLRNLRDVIVSDELEKIRRPDEVRDSFILPWLPSQGELTVVEAEADRQMMVAYGTMERWR